MKHALFIGSFIALAGCGHTLQKQDVTALHDAQELTLNAYTASGPQSPERAMDRAAFCALEGVLHRNGASGVDAGSTIVCAQPESEKGAPR